MARPEVGKVWGDPQAGPREAFGPPISAGRIGSQWPLTLERVSVSAEG